MCAIGLGKLVGILPMFCSLFISKWLQRDGSFLELRVLLGVLSPLLIPSITTVLRTVNTAFGDLRGGVYQFWEEFDSSFSRSLSEGNITTMNLYLIWGVSVECRPFKSRLCTFPFSLLTDHQI